MSPHRARISIGFIRAIRVIRGRFPFRRIKQFAGLGLLGKRRGAILARVRKKGGSENRSEASDPFSALS
jgi:hypothetical protein